MTARSRGRDRSWSRHVAVAIQTLLAAGVVLRVTLRDGIPGLAVLYYALPLGVLTALSAALFGLSLYERRRRAMLVYGTVALLMAGWWTADQWYARPAAAGDRPLRIVFWNVCRGSAGWDEIAREVSAYGADVVALVEAGEPSDELRALWRTRCPEYDVSFLGGGMMCLVRGTSGEARVPHIDGHSQARELDVSIDGREFRCLIVDIYADVLYDRKDALHWVAEIANRSADRPLLILGDFNTPVDSVHFAELRQRHANAFESRGSGWIATWPTFCPLLALDQIWANDRIRLLQCRHDWSRLSDHRPVVLTVTVPDPNSAFSPDGT